MSNTVRKVSSTMAGKSREVIICLSSIPLVMSKLMIDNGGGHHEGTRTYREGLASGCSMITLSAHSPKNTRPWQLP
jgi:hypothetical protein